MSEIQLGDEKLHADSDCDSIYVKESSGASPDGLMKFRILDSRQVVPFAWQRFRLSLQKNKNKGHQRYSSTVPIVSSLGYAIRTMSSRSIGEILTVSFAQGLASRLRRVSMRTQRCYCLHFKMQQRKNVSDYERKLELRRQIQHVRKVAAYVRRQRSSATPANFLQVVQNLERVMESFEMYTGFEPRCLNEVRPDLAIEGRLTVDGRARRVHWWWHAGGRETSCAMTCIQVPSHSAESRDQSGREFCGAMLG